MTSPETCVEALCQIPDNLRRTGASFKQLVDQSGFTECHAQVTAEQLAHYIQRHYHLVEHWLTFSADQRSADAPFFDRVLDHFEVGYLHSIKPPRRFDHDEGAAACATFILEHLAKYAPTAPH